MKMRIFATCLVICSVAGATGVSDDLELELKSIFRTIETNYGPLEMKKVSMGLDWPKIKNEYLSRLATLRDTREFYSLAANLLNGFNDAHVSIQLPSSYEKTLPLQFSYAQGKTVLNYFEPKELETTRCSVRLGDELLAIDGHSLEEARLTNPVFSKFGNDLTNRAMFARQITQLREERGLLISIKPKSEVVFKLGRDGASYSCSLTYSESGIPLIGKPVQRPVTLTESVSVRSLLAAILAKERNAPQLTDSEYRRLETINQTFKKLNSLADLGTPMESPSMEKEKKESGKGKNIEIGQVEPFFPLPSHFEPIRLSPVSKILSIAMPLFAGTFEAHGRRVGFLRIPSYTSQIPLLSPLVLRMYINKLESTSDVLIVDQMNNPGGMIVLSDLFVKSLTGKYDDAKHMKFAVKPTQSFMRTYAMLIETLSNPLKAGIGEEDRIRLLECAKEDYELIYQAYLSGQNLSHPVSLKFMSEYMELAIQNLFDSLPIKDLLARLIGAPVFDPQVYTKPVYFLTNELDFSGGDATPAILQDYGRVKLVGVRTAGAGGSVEEFSNDVENSFKYHLTTSLMIRANGSLVENVGVHPDIPFEVSVKDYTDGFVNFVPRLLETIF